MILLRIYIVITGLLIVASCGREIKDVVPGKGEIIHINPLDLTNKEDLKLSQLIDTFHVIKLETKPGALVGRVTKLVTDDDKIFIFDRYSASVFIFNQSGKLITKIHREGQGPQEYIQIGDIALNTDSNNLLIFDKLGGKILFFDYNGELVRSLITKEIIFSKIAYAGNNSYLLYSSFQNTESSTRFNIFKIDDTGKIIWRAFPLEKEIGNVPVDKNSIFSGKSQVIYSPLLENTIYRFVKDEFTPSYTLDFEKYNMETRDFFKFSSTSAPEKVIMVDLLNENDRTIVFNYLFKGKLPQLYIDKTTKHQYYSHSFKFDIPFLPWGVNVVGMQNESFITLIYPNDIKKRLEAFKSINKANANKILMNYKQVADLKDISPTDNPVLFVYKLNRF